MNNASQDIPQEFLLTYSLRLRYVKRNASSSAADPQPTSCKEALPQSNLSDDLNMLPALSTLNLPSSVRRSSSNVVPKLNKDFVDPTSLPHIVKKPKNVQKDFQLGALTKLPRSIGGDTSALLRDISVEPTASNAELFHLCK